jgi:hypothetical protein
LVGVNDEGERFAPGIFLRPTDNELFRVVIEVLLVKGRRVHRIKELFDPIDEDLDPVRCPFADFETMNHWLCLVQAAIWRE